MVDTEWPCLRFGRTDVSSPLEVAGFILWLLEGLLPSSESAWALIGSGHPDPALLLETFWAWDAPRHRMAKLLWQRLQGNDDEGYFVRRFTQSRRHLAEDCATCGDVLPQIQADLREVLRGLAERAAQDKELGQASWGEPYWLPGDQARRVRDHLAGARVTLLERESDYEEALLWDLNYLETVVIGGIEVPCADPARGYAIRRGYGNGRSLPVEALVKAENAEHRLRNVCEPEGRWGGFGWGYYGSGARALAASILADTMNGDVVTAERLAGDFVNEFLAHEHGDILELSRLDVLVWLETKGVSPESIEARSAALRARRAEVQGRVASIRRRKEQIRGLASPLVVQRFDIVPTAFESSLYVDLVGMLQEGGFLMVCSRCGLPISGGEGSGNGRRSARWDAGLPVYHPDCAVAQARDRKRAFWHQRAQDPGFREKHRNRMRSLRERGAKHDE